MPRSKRGQKPKPTSSNIPSTTSSSSCSGKTSSKKKVKKKDLRGPHWTKNQDYVQTSKIDGNEGKREQYPMIKGEAVIDLQREYQTNPEKFVFNDRARKLKAAKNHESEETSTETATDPNQVPPKSAKSNSYSNKTPRSTQNWAILMSILRVSRRTKIILNS